MKKSFLPLKIVKMTCSFKENITQNTLNVFEHRFANINHEIFISV